MEDPLNIKSEPQDCSCPLVPLEVSVVGNTVNALEEKTSIAQVWLENSENNIKQECNTDVKDDVSGIMKTDVSNSEQKRLQNPECDPRDRVAVKGENVSESSSQEVNCIEDINCGEPIKESTASCILCCKLFKPTISEDCDKPLFCVACSDTFKLLNNEPDKLRAKNISLYLSNMFAVKCSGTDKDSVLACDECGKQFARKSHLLVHLKPSAKSGTFRCGVCDANFTRFSCLKHHHMNAGCVVTPNELVCITCGKLFTDRKKFSDHLQVHKVTGLYECTICNKTFKKRMSLKMHGVVHESQPRHYGCALCDKSFLRRDYLVTHLKYHAENTEYICQKCGKAYLHKTLLNRHLRRHAVNKRFNCEICGCGFIQNFDLQRHLKSAHTPKEKPICANCGKVFDTSLNLKLHERTHVKSYPFNCEICNIGFSKSYNLKKHNKSKHSEKGDDKFECEYCEKTFSARSHYTLHRKTHLLFLPYKCKICDVGFPKMHYLRNHNRSKHGEKSESSFECQICYESFPLFQDLKSHEKSNHLKCNICNIEYKRLSDIKGHNTLKHNHEIDNIELLEPKVEISEDIS